MKPPPAKPRTIGKKSHPVTPDGRYFVVRGRLWRMANPALPPADREKLVSNLMASRRKVATANKQGDSVMAAAAHADIDDIKQRLGERGAVWWQDDSPDYNRHMARTTPYAKWYREIQA